MAWLALVGGVWLVASLAVGVVVGKAIAAADREGPEDRPDTRHRAGGPRRPAVR